MPGVNPQGRFTSLTSPARSRVTGEQVNVTLSLTSSTRVSSITAGTLRRRPRAAPPARSLTGPTLTSADTTSPSTSDPVTYRVDAARSRRRDARLAHVQRRHGHRQRPRRLPGRDLEQRARLAAADLQVTVPNGAPNPVSNTASSLTDQGSRRSRRPSRPSAAGRPSRRRSRTSPGDPRFIRATRSRTRWSSRTAAPGNATGVVVTDTLSREHELRELHGRHVVQPFRRHRHLERRRDVAGRHRDRARSRSRRATTLAISDSPYTSRTRRTSLDPDATPMHSNTVTNPLEVQPTIVKTVRPGAGTGDTLTYTLRSATRAPHSPRTSPIRASRRLLRRGRHCSPACTFGGGTVTWNGTTIQPGHEHLHLRRDRHRDRRPTDHKQRLLDPTSPNLSRSRATPVETEVGPLHRDGQARRPEAAGRPRRHDHVQPRDRERVQRRRPERRRRRPGAGRHDVRGRQLHDAGRDLQPLLRQRRPGTSATCAADVGRDLSFQVTVGTLPPGDFQIPNQRPRPPPTRPSRRRARRRQHAPDPDLLAHENAVAGHVRPRRPRHLTTRTSSRTTTPSTSPGRSRSPTTRRRSAARPATSSPGVEDCTATYTITQADLDAGSVTNTAQATSATQPHSNNAQATVTARAVAVLRC